MAISCDNPIIRKWYEEDAIVEITDDSCDITAYLFVSPDSVGQIADTGSGETKSDRVQINITYPSGKSGTLPASEEDIQIIHTGESISPEGGWDGGGGGVLIRRYTVTARNGREKYYRVIATTLITYDNTGSFFFTPTNGLIEGNINTEPGAIAGVFTDPDGVPPFKYDFVDEKDKSQFEIVEEEGNTVLKIFGTALTAKSPWIVTVKVTDDAGNSTSGPASFTVHPAGTSWPITGDFTFTPMSGLWTGSLDGEAVGIFSQPEGGIAKFKYELYQKNDYDNDNFRIPEDSNLLYFNPENRPQAGENKIRVKVTDSAKPAQTRTQTFTVTIGNGMLRITDHPVGTQSYKAQFYSGLTLTAANFASLPSGSSDAEYQTTARYGTIEIIIYSTNIDNIKCVKLRNDSGVCAGYFNDVEFDGDGFGELSWYDVWHTYTDVAAFKSSMQQVELVYNDGHPYKIALSGIDMEEELSAGKTADLYSRLYVFCSYVVDFRGCTGTRFAPTPDTAKAASINEVYLNEGLTGIGDGAFDGARNLATVSIPKSRIKTIGERAFADCNEFTEVDLSNCESLESVGNGAFYSTYNGGYSKISSVDFSGCTSLKSVGENAFRECRQLGTIDFSNCSVLDTIGSYAFYNCYALGSVDLSDTALITIGSYAFYDCNALGSVNLSVTALETIGDQAFFSCNALGSVNLSGTKLEIIGSYAFYHCDTLTSVDLSTVKDTLENIYNSAFQNCFNLITADLSSCAKLVTIGSSAFQNCYSLTTGDLSSCTLLETIGNHAFYDCNALGSVNLSGTKLEIIGSYAFYHCDTLTSVDLSTVGNTLITIDNNAFQYCVNLHEVNLSSCTALGTIGNSAFQYCGAFTENVSMNHHYALKTIGNYAFAYSGITSINLQNCTNITAINDSTFRECAKLATVTIEGTSIANIYNNAFYGCTALPQLDFAKIKGTLLTIGNSAFQGAGLTTADLHECSSLTTTGTYAFSECNSLTSIHLPANLEKVNDNLLNGCTGLTDIKFDTVTPTDDIFSPNSFLGLPVGLTVYVPSGQVEKYKAFWNQTNHKFWQNGLVITT